MIRRIATALTALLLAGLAGAQPEPAKVEVLWLGQSCFRITTPTGKVIVTDPWLLQNPKTPPEYRKLEALGKVDVLPVRHEQMRRRWRRCTTCPCVRRAT